MLLILMLKNFIIFLHFFALPLIWHVFLCVIFQSVLATRTHCTFSRNRATNISISSVLSPFSPVFGLHQLSAAAKWSIIFFIFSISPLFGAEYCAILWSCEAWSLWENPHLTYSPQNVTCDAAIKSGVSRTLNTSWCYTIRKKVTIQSFSCNMDDFFCTIL